MPSCQLCQASGFRLPTKNCKKCGRLMCQTHWYAVPIVPESQLLEALQGRTTMLSRGSTSQVAIAWMANAATAPDRWREARFFCGVQCAAGFVGTLTPHDIAGADGQPLRVLTYSEFGTSASTRGGEVDYSRMASAGGIFVVVGTNLPAELQSVFRARATSADLLAQESARARTAWSSGDYVLAAEIYDRLGQTQYAAQARDLARTQKVVSVSVNTNQLMEQLKELRRPITYNCKSCGKSVELSSARGVDKIVKCEYCGRDFSIPDVMAEVNRVLSMVPSGSGPTGPTTGG